MIPDFVRDCTRPWVRSQFAGHYTVNGHEKPVFFKKTGFLFYLTGTAVSPAHGATSGMKDMA